MTATTSNTAKDECSRLYEQSLRGDADAATQLYAKCVPPLRGWLAQRVSYHLAEEMAHVAMVEVFRQADRFQPGHSFQGWLRAIAWNRALNSLRNESRRQAREQVYWQDAQMHDSGDCPPAPRLDRLASALAALPAGQRELLELHYIQGRTSQAVAEAHGRSRSAVAVNLHRLRQKLRTDIESPRKPRGLCHPPRKLAA